MCRLYIYFKETSKPWGRFYSNFVCFSESPNFTKCILFLYVTKLGLSTYYLANSSCISQIFWLMWHIWKLAIDNNWDIVVKTLIVHFFRVSPLFVMTLQGKNKNKNKHGSKRLVFCSSNLQKMQDIKFSLKITIQAFLDFLGLDFWDFQFTVVYNSILSSSPLVLPSTLDSCGFRSAFYLNVPTLTL